jgi:hypothetical protein
MCSISFQHQVAERHHQRDRHQEAEAVERAGARGPLRHPHRHAAQQEQARRDGRQEDVRMRDAARRPVRRLHAQVEVACPERPERDELDHDQHQHARPRRGPPPRHRRQPVDGLPGIVLLGPVAALRPVPADERGRRPAPCRAAAGPGAPSRRRCRRSAPSRSRTATGWASAGSAGDRARRPWTWSRSSAAGRAPRRPWPPPPERRSEIRRLRVERCPRAGCRCAPPADGGSCTLVAASSSPTPACRRPTGCRRPGRRPAPMARH